MAFLEIASLTKGFNGQRVLPGLDLSIGAGEFWALVGPSGCGKSVLLRIIAGLLSPDGGTMSLGGRDIAGLRPAERDIAMVFQSYALYPHLTVAGNLGIGLRHAGMSRDDTRCAVDRAAETLGLTPLLNRLPQELSGGERQRVDQTGGDLTGWVEHVETLGSETNVFVRTDNLGIVAVRLFGHRDFAPGEELSLRLDRRRELYFDGGGKRIR